MRPSKSAERFIQRTAVKVSSWRATVSRPSGTIGITRSKPRTEVRGYTRSDPPGRRRKAPLSGQNDSSLGYRLLRFPLESGFALFIIVVVGMTGGGCRKAEPLEARPQSESTVVTPPIQTTPDTTSQVDPQANWESVKVELEALDDPNRWLTVLGGNKEAASAWATARFDRGRNRLEIETRDVLEFEVDMSRVAVDWSKLVVLRIDDRNTELKKRDQAVYKFVRGGEGQWRVEE